MQISLNTASGIDAAPQHANCEQIHRYGGIADIYRRKSFKRLEKFVATAVA
jgi:hypothetical protein